VFIFLQIILINFKSEVRTLFGTSFGVMRVWCVMLPLASMPHEHESDLVAKVVFALLDLVATVVAVSVAQIEVELLVACVPV
jgi:hypothetical protein